MHKYGYKSNIKFAKKGSSVQTIGGKLKVFFYIFLSLEHHFIDLSNSHPLHFLVFEYSVYDIDYKNDKKQNGKNS